MKVMYLDESGDHNLENIKPDYPVFVLGGVIVDRTYARTIIEPRLRQLKQEFFGREDIVLHTADIIRAKKEFACLENPGLKGHFLAAITTMMRELEYKVVACAIKKDEHVARYGSNAADPYSYCLDVLVERFCLEMGAGEDRGIIFAERRRPDLDHDLDLAWERLKATSTGFMKGSDVDERIVDLVLKDKRLNIAGLQLADLVVSPIGRAVVGKRTHTDWEVVKSKFRTGWSGYNGYGLVVLPK